MSQRRLLGWLRFKDMQRAPGLLLRSWWLGVQLMPLSCYGVPFVPLTRTKSPRVTGIANANECPHDQMFQLQCIPMKTPESYLCDTLAPKSLGAVLPHAARSIRHQQAVPHLLAPRRCIRSLLFSNKCEHGTRGTSSICLRPGVDPKAMSWRRLVEDCLSVVWPVEARWCSSQCMHCRDRQAGG